MARKTFSIVKVVILNYAFFCMTGGTFSTEVAGYKSESSYNSFRFTIVMFGSPLVS
jgi:hypothetical protein